MNKVSTSVVSGEPAQVEGVGIVVATSCDSPDSHARKHAVCSRCNEDFNREFSPYCKKCHAEYMREWRKENPLTEDARFKMNARAYAHVYLKRGIIKKLDCRNCGNPNSEMHHEDYMKPVDVIWLCRKCHLNEHYVLEKITHLKRALFAATGKHYE